MRNIKIIIEYDGTRYSGWQIQKNTKFTVQNVLQDALTIINKSPVKVIGAGRTDGGVHALGQVANFRLAVPIPINKIVPALNSLLPNDIVCLRAEEVQLNFHARFSAKGKKYRYRIFNKRIPSVFKRNYTYHYSQKLNINLMKKAASYLEGVHDFASFQASGSSIIDTVRNIAKIDILDQDSEIWIEVKGDGFLYKMVRCIVGTLIEVGCGKIKSVEIKGILRAKNRQKAGFTAPAQGLTLLEVYY